MEGREEKKRCGVKRIRRKKEARIELINVRRERGKEGEIQKMKGSEVDVRLVMETHEIEGVWAKGIPGFERLGK